MASRPSHSQLDATTRPTPQRIRLTYYKDAYGRERVRRGRVINPALRRPPAKPPLSSTPYCERAARGFLLRIRKVPSRMHGPPASQPREKGVRQPALLRTIART